MKKCPFCAEDIQDEAIVCKHCGRDLKPQVKMGCITFGFLAVVLSLVVVLAIATLAEHCS